jgi:hypothetical protein
MSMNRSSKESPVGLLYVLSFVVILAVAAYFGQDYARNAPFCEKLGLENFCNR